MRGRLPFLALGLALWIAVTAWFAAGAVGDWRFRSELEQSRRPSRQGARRGRVAPGALAKRRPGEGEVEYWLGRCEREQGRPSAALAAWGRVPDAAPEAAARPWSAGAWPSISAVTRSPSPVSGALPARGARWAARRDGSSAGSNG